MPTRLISRDQVAGAYTAEQAGVDVDNLIRPDDQKKMLEETERLSSFMEFMKLTASGATTTQNQIQYWQRHPDSRQGDIVDVFDDLGSPYTTGAKDKIIKLQLLKEQAMSITKYNQLVIHCEALRKQRTVHVRDVVVKDDVDGVGVSWVTAKLKQADTDNVLAQPVLSFIRSNGQLPRLHGLPDGVISWPEPLRNRVNWIGSSYAIEDPTRIEQEVIEPQLMERLAKDTLADHIFGRYMVYFFSRLADNDDLENSTTPIPMMRGFFEALENEYPDHFIDLPTYDASTDPISTPVVLPGYTWENYALGALGEISRRGSQYKGDEMKLLFCSGYTISRLMDAIDAKTTKIIEPSSKEFGFEIRKLNVPGGKPIALVQDGAFDKLTALRQKMVMVETGVMDIIHFKGDEPHFIQDLPSQNPGKTAENWKKEGWLEGFTARYGYKNSLVQCYVLDGAGMNNIVSAGV